MFFRQNLKNTPHYVNYPIKSKIHVWMVVQRWESVTQHALWQNGAFLNSYRLLAVTIKLSRVSELEISLFKILLFHKKTVENLRLLQVPAANLKMLFILPRDGTTISKLTWTLHFWTYLSLASMNAFFTAFVKRLRIYQKTSYKLPRNGHI